MRRPLEISQEKDANLASRDSTPPPAKKARTAPSPQDITLPRVVIIKENAPWFPALLHGFPPLLSPTLPPSIEEELAKLEANVKAAINEKPGQKKTSETSISSSSIKSQGQSPFAHLSQTTSSLKDRIDLCKKSETHVSELKRSATSPASKNINPIRGVANSQKQLTPTANPKEKAAKATGNVGTKLLPNSISKSGNEMASLAGPKSNTDHSEKESLIVKLKIPKSARRNWAALIRLAPRPRKPEFSQQPSNEKLKDRAREPALASGLDKTREQPQQRKALMEQAKDVKDAAAKTGEKRRRLDAVNDPESSIKRHKPTTSPVPNRKSQTPTLPNKPHTSSLNQKPYASALSHKPHTPVRSILKSPALSQSKSIQKYPTPTPKRTLAGIAMQRITSQEADVQTPFGGTRGGTPTAPNSIERGNRDGRSASNPSLGGSSSVHGEDLAMVGEPSGGHSGDAVNSSGAVKLNGHDGAAAWKHEQTRHLGLGRTLKHKSDGLIKVGAIVNPDEVARERGVAIAVETILCYMLGFIAGDEALRTGGKAGDASGWRSLLPYIQYTINMIDHPHLKGLVLQLEAVCREIIHVYDIDRLKRETLPGEEVRSNPASNDAFSMPLSKGEKLHQYTEFKNSLVDNARLARQNWLQGKARLTNEKLEESYPLTWGKRAEAPPEEDSKEKLVPNEYNRGTFYLPLSSTSSGIEAVRLGWSFLNEWSTKFEVQWEGKLSL